LLTLENSLVMTWLQFQVARLIVYRDLGTLPYDEWEAFSELFPSESLTSVGGPAAARPGPRLARDPAPGTSEVVRQ
jgi:hypothetical protein